MRRVHHLLPQQSRITLYNALIVPLFDYANIIWGDKNDVTLMDSLQILQNKAAKVILALSPNHSAGEAFEPCRIHVTTIVFGVIGTLTVYWTFTLTEQ